MNSCTKCGSEHPGLMPCRAEEGGSVVAWLCPDCLSKSGRCLGCGKDVFSIITPNYCEECLREKHEANEQTESSFADDFMDE